MTEPFSFKYQLSTMAKERLDPSEIGVMIKLSIEHKAISLTAGEPSADIYPIDDLKKAFAPIFDDPSLLAYAKEDFGLMELRQEVANYLNRRSHTDYKASEILITVGLSEAVFDMLCTILDEGDELLIPDPVWMNYLNVPKLLGAVPVSYELREENGWAAAVCRFAE